MVEGLTRKEVAKRFRDGLNNDYRPPTSRTVSSILMANIFTLFNAILSVALVMIFLFGYPQDALFGLVMVANALTGIISELRAKRTLDKLAILDTADVCVIRDGKEIAIPPTDIVKDDVLRLKIGDQIPADGVVLETKRFQVDESILTGESLPLYKKKGDRLLSGSSVVSGQAYALMTTVGEHSYANRMSKQVKRFHMADSELEDGINWILRLILFALPFVIAALIASQVNNLGGIHHVNQADLWSKVVVATVSGVVSMIPQGLVLLTSVNFASAAIILARQHRVLVQDLPAVEVLARVDTLCLDKTGTITSGNIEGLGCAPITATMPPISKLSDVLHDDDIRALATLVADGSNATAEAVRDMVDADAFDDATMIPFSSMRKWSLVSDKGMTWVFGAPEIISKNAPHMLEHVANFADQGIRVILLAKVEGAYQVDDTATEHSLPEGLQPCALILLAEEVRKGAHETLDYLHQQGIDIKVISGDNPRTVGAIATRAGLADNPRILDASTVDVSDIDAMLMTSYDVFGRVTPEQKRHMVAALQSDGKTVAMTGDGVNDALALKEADLGIAMGSGAQATKAAAKVVLLDSSFLAMPAVLAQGRRVLGNMERVSTLFLAKTIYAIVIALLVAATLSPYPFLPRHLTLVGSMTIGIPAFFLALAPSRRRYRPGFLRRSLSLAVPAGFIAGLTTLAAYFSSTPDVASTVATLTLAVIALVILGVLSQPIATWRGILLAVMAGVIAVVALIPPLRHFFALADLSLYMLGIVAVAGAIGSACIIVVGVWWSHTFYSHKKGE